MATETIDRKRIEAAVRRLAVLPERRAEVGRAVTGLMYVIERAALKLDTAPPPAPPEPQPIPEPEPEPEPEAEPEVDEALLVAAKELRETQYFIDDFKDAWTGLSAPARDALGLRLRAAGMAEAEVDAMMALLGRVAEAMAVSADALEQPEPPAPPPAPESAAAPAPAPVAAPAPTPTPEDPPLVIAQHVARMYTRLTGRKPPKPKADDDITRGAFYWLLQDVLGASGIVAAADRYARLVARR